MPRAALAIALLLAAVTARAQPRPPLFVPEAWPAQCGATADHLRLLDEAEFEPAWRGSHRDGSGVLLLINHEGFWLALAWSGATPDRACILGQGLHFTYGPFGSQ